MIRALLAVSLVVCASPAWAWHGHPNPTDGMTMCQQVARQQQSSAVLEGHEKANTAYGALWAFAKSACNNGEPVAGVDPAWAAGVWSQLQTPKQIAPK